MIYIYLLKFVKLFFFVCYIDFLAIVCNYVCLNMKKKVLGKVVYIYIDCSIENTLKLNSLGFHCSMMCK